MFVATINIPGYSPMDDDPPTFDTAREAWAWLAEERKRGEDDTEGEEYSVTADALTYLGSDDAEYDPRNRVRTRLDNDHLGAVASDGTGAVYGGTPGYDGTHDLGLAYCVSVAEETS